MRSVMLQEAFDKLDNIHIVLDSVSCCRETELINNPRVHVLRLTVSHGDLEWLDGDKELSEMFALVDKTGKLPITSQPPLGTIIELFTELSKQGKKIIMFTLDSVLSGTYSTACMAAKQVMQEVEGADIRVIDSLTAATPIVSMAAEILKKVDAGETDMDVLEAYGKDLAYRTETIFSVNTLDYLQKGGRIGAASALIGGFLGIRPIITLDRDGNLKVADKCRTRKRVMKRMVEIAAEEGPVEAVFVANAEAPEDAVWLRDELAKEFPGVPMMMTSIGTVLAAHLGPGVIGVFVRRKA